MDRFARKNLFTAEVPKRPGERRVWGRLYGSSKALAIRIAVERNDVPLIVVTADSLTANRMQNELQFFSTSNNTLPIISFPDWETLPYDQFSPYRDITSERLATLTRAPMLTAGILIVPVSTLMHRLAPRHYVDANSLHLSIGDRLEIDQFRQRLGRGGYCRVSQVMEHGDFAVRGSLIDIFPMGSDLPYRIDLFDEEVEGIRLFDPETQRSQEKINSICILPAHEFPLTKEAIGLFRSQWRMHFEGNATECPIYRDVSHGLAPAGIEYYLSLFFHETHTLLDYLPQQCVVVIDDGVEQASNAFWEDIRERYEQGRHDGERPLLPPREIFLDPSELASAMGNFPQLLLRTGSNDESPSAVNYAVSPPKPLPIDARATDPLAVLKRFLDEFNGRVLFVAESSGRRETLLELLSEHDLRPQLFDTWSAFVMDAAPLGMTVAPLEQGTQLDDPVIAIISETQLFGERAMQRRLRRRTQRDVDSIVRNLTELSAGAPVVHEEHGVGRYQGLVTLEVNDVRAEFICVEYARGDKLYVPVSSLHLISRYTGVDAEHAPLHRLGSAHWQRAKRKAAERAFDVAAELLELHARRAARGGFSYTIDEDAYRAFAHTFPFEETPDQMAAIQAVLSDMQDDKPMDRLICGDPGFGKTEVAMRAAFVAVQDGKQVALLAPTTLLVQQHHQNFLDRFADWPVRIEQLSRFRSHKEQDSVINALATGSVDIVIGTHKLFRETIKFKRLGLVVIDEEHRFGVRQKEKFKALRAEVDLLTLTATPIPRTLNMALSGLRELSIIATPPSGRLAVKTFVREWNAPLVREAVLREIKRGGQVYFLHNEVQSIEKMAKRLESLIPEARVCIAHGQMREKELEQVMLDFYHRRVNVLVCTTIVESGIDVPTANTIVINRADKFGLAQLYQLRGRVGRAHHRAYAYLTVPARNVMTADAQKRLQAIESLEDLGVGFTLATHDLEIRGAGEILGEEQSGHIQEIGFGLYMDLLERAVQALQAGRQPELDRPLDHGTEIDLHIPALLPEDYLPDVHMRLIMYKRIANARNDDELTDLQVEMIDRFGLLPEPAKNLFRITALKLKATPMGIHKIDLGKDGGRVRFQPCPAIDPMRVMKLIQLHPQTYKLDGQDRLRVMKELPDGNLRIELLTDLLDQLETRDAA